MQLQVFKAFFLWFFPSPLLFSSYLLKNQTIMDASKVNFPAVTLKERMHKVRFPQ